MIRIWMACLIAATTAFAGAQAGKNAQKPAAAPSTQSPNPPTLKKPGERPPDVLPSQPVITVKGLCLAETGAATKAAVPGTKDCVVTVTREQFDTLLKAFNPNNQPLPAETRRKVAQSYVELLVYSQAAKAAGVENSPEYAEVMRVLRLRTLGEIYRAQLAEQYKNPSPEEIEAYYKENQSKFESAKLSRIYVPKNNPDPKATAEQKQAFQTKVQPVAEDVQARAAKGEAPDKLQKEAYTTLGIAAAPPATEMTAVRRGMFPAKLEQDIFSHKAGDVFRSDDANGFVIYRVDSLQPAPLDSVKDEVAREIFRRKMEDKMKELNSSVQASYDDAYFGPPAAPGAPAGAQAPNPPK